MQIKHIEQISYILNKFNEKGIEAVILKGLALRHLYSKPELRTMCDADFLIKNEDYDSAVQCLLEIGYVSNNHDNDIHKGFIKANALEIEIHNKLVNNDFIDVDFSQYESQLWRNVETIKINGVETKTLGKEDFVIHLILHMAVHTKLYGFGIRQLYDLAVFVKKYYEKTNWDIVKEKLLAYRFLRYSQGIMMTINKLFDITIPKIFFNKNINTKDIDMLIKSIMDSGVHGKKELNEDFKILYESSNHHKDESIIFMRILRFFIPRRSDIINQYDNKYEYIKSNIFLMPFVWVDRIANGYLKKYGFIETLQLVSLSINILKRRNRIIKVFDLPY